MVLFRIHHGHRRAKFTERIRDHIFANGHTDYKIVCDLYHRIFPLVASREELVVWAWGDAEALELLQGLDDLVGLKKVTVHNLNVQNVDDNFVGISPAVKQQLSSALRNRGGQLHLRQNIA